MIKEIFNVATAEFGEDVYEFIAGAVERKRNFTGVVIKFRFADYGTFTGIGFAVRSNKDFDNPKEGINAAIERFLTLFDSFDCVTNSSSIGIPEYMCVASNHKNYFFPIASAIIGPKPKKTTLIPVYATLCNMGFEALGKAVMKAYGISTPERKHFIQVYNKISQEAQHYGIV